MAIVDGSHARIPAPKRHRVCYFNRKNYASIQYQVRIRVDIIKFSKVVDSP